MPSSYPRVVVGTEVAGEWVANDASAVVAAQGTPTSRAGTITTGGTAQTLAAANTVRKGALVQNNSASDLRVEVTTTASATVGARVAPGQMLVLLQPFCGTGEISIWGATTAQAFHALETV